MRICRLISVIVLLLAGAAWAVNTVSPLNNKGSNQIEQDVVSGVGPLSEGAVEMYGQSLEVPSSLNGTLVQTLDVFPDFSALQGGDPAASLVQGTEPAEGQPTRGPAGGVNNAVDWVTGHHWSTDPEKYSDAGFVDASSHAGLPAFDEMDLAAAPLPAAKEISIMEIVVFPALAVVVLILAVALVVLRLRRRRSESGVQHLLQV